REDPPPPPPAATPTPYHHGRATRGPGVSDRTIFQLREGEGLVTHPCDDLGSPDERTGRPAAVVPQRRAAAVTQFESQDARLPSSRSSEGPKVAERGGGGGTSQE